MAIKIQGSTILDDNRNLLSGNTITATSFVGPLTGNATTVTNGVYTNGDQSIGGVKTFTGIPAFNGGVSGTSAPFTVDSTTVVTNLNADLLDGQNLVSTDSTINTVAGRDSQGDIRARLIRTTHTEDSSITSTAGVHMRNNANTDNYSRVVTGTGFVNWLKNYDGAGSGLDADLLDGVQGASYLRSDANDTASGLISFDRGAATYTEAFVLQSGTPADGNPGLFFKKADSNTVNLTMWNGSTVQGKLVINSSTTEIKSSTTEINSETSVFGDDGTNGYLQLNRGNTINPGYISFHTPDNVRRSYIGWNDSNQNALVAENGWGWSVTGNVNFDSATMFVDATSNRVGIGTISPSEKLHVEGTTRSLSFASANGSASSPAYNFTADTNTGMFLLAADTLGFATNGSPAAVFTSTGNLRLYNTAGTQYTEIANQPTATRTLTLPNADVSLVGGTMATIDTNQSISGIKTFTNPIRADSGSAAAPSITFSSDTNTGIYLAGADSIGFATNGATAAVFTSTGNLRLYNTAGTQYTVIANQPTETRTLTLPNADVSLVGGTMATIDTNQSISGIKTFTSPIRAADGSVAAPSISFSTAAGTGIFQPFPASIGFTTGGVYRGNIGTGGNLNWFEDILITKSLNNEETVTVGVESTNVGVEIGFARIGTRVNSTIGKYPIGFFRVSKGADGGNIYMWTDAAGTWRTSSAASAIGNNTATAIGAQTSDERIKIIQPTFGYGVSEVRKLKPIRFRYLEDAEDVSRLGFGAQTTQQVIPESVFDSGECLDGYTKDPENPDNETPNSDRTKMYMEYVQLIPVLTAALQEADRTIQTLAERIAALEERLN